MEDRQNLATWHVDKKSGVPLYLQVKELVRQHATVRKHEQLPSVHEVSNALGITFETVRKAYKALASEGVISMSRGRRSVASQANDTAQPVDLLTRTKEFLTRELLPNLDADSARLLVQQAFDELSRDPAIIFAECNQLQVDELSADLERQLGVGVQGVLLEDLAARAEQTTLGGARFLVLTTGFHLNEVSAAMEGLDIEVDCVVTSMSPNMRRELQGFSKDTRFGVLCPSWESVPFYRDVIVAELGIGGELLCGVPSDAEMLMEKLDVLLCAAPVFEGVQSTAPAGCKVFNVFDRVDPASVMMIRERLRVFRQANA